MNILNKSCDASVKFNEGIKSEWAGRSNRMFEMFFQGTPTYIFTHNKNAVENKINKIKRDHNYKIRTF